MFKAANNVGLEIIPGKNLHAIVVDFSLAQINGIKKSFNILFGDQGNSLFDLVIQGCETHFKRSCLRVKSLVAKSEIESDAFYQSCMKIINCEKKEVVQDIFTFITSNWPGCKNWASFWNREKVLSLFSKAYSKNPMREIIPKDTNACESAQKLVKSCGTRGIATQFIDGFMLDKRNFIECRNGFELGVALEYGVPSTFSVEERTKLKRKIQKKDQLSKKDALGRACDRRSDGITCKQSKIISYETLKSVESVIDNEDSSENSESSQGKYAVFTHVIRSS